MTSQAETKKNNRKCELELRETELFATFAKLYHGLDYPREKITQLWKTVLLNQFVSRFLSIDVKP